MPENQINHVEFNKEGLAISYIRLPKDVRKNGLVWQHNVLVPFRSDYDDEIEVVTDGLDALLADVLDDEDRAEEVDPKAVDEDEDES